MKLLKAIAAVCAWGCIGVFLLLVIYSNYDAYLSPKARLAQRNASHIRHVRIGMDTSQVARIMGQAAEVHSIQQDYIYTYEHQPGSSSSYQIEFDAAYKVKDVYILD
jgi:hypothetical protein